MKILVLGASKGVGLETVKAGLDSGHDVRAFARSASKMNIDHDALERVDGDATNTEDIIGALDGVDAVVETLGVPLSASTVIGGTNLYSTVGRILVDAMEQRGPKRLIAVTGLGAGNARDHLGPLFSIGFQFSLKRIYDDKDIQEQIIKRSSLAWTIARPGILRDGETTGLYQVLTDPTTWRVGDVRRADVAHFVIEELETDRYMHQTPLLIS
ncbi:MAG: NAD(P)H-binding protein [Pseudomonadota bacterium]